MFFFGPACDSFGEFDLPGLAFLAFVVGRFNWLRPKDKAVVLLQRLQFLGNYIFNELYCKFARVCVLSGALSPEQEPTDGLPDDS